MFRILSISAVALMLFATSAEARGHSSGGRVHYGGGHHTYSHGGHYAGGHGSSHRGGHYMICRCSAALVGRRGSGAPLSASAGRVSAVSTSETDSGFQLTEGFGLIAVT